MPSAEARRAKLTRLLELAGAADPAALADSEVAEGIPQLARYLFPDGATDWIDRAVRAAEDDPGSPGAGMGLVLNRLLAKGAAREDLSELARTAQWQLLHDICYLLSDPSIDEQELSHVGWALFEVSDAGEIGRCINGLHESVLETDPSGREMRPQDAV
jgi:hypothetical protein